MFRSITSRSSKMGKRARVHHAKIIAREITKQGA